MLESTNKGTGDAGSNHRSCLVGGHCFLRSDNSKGPWALGSKEVFACPPDYHDQPQVTLGQVSVSMALPKPLALCNISLPGGSLPAFRPPPCHFFAWPALPIESPEATAAVRTVALRALPLQHSQRALSTRQPQNPATNAA